MAVPFLSKKNPLRYRRKNLYLTKPTKTICEYWRHCAINGREQDIARETLQFC